MPFTPCNNSKSTGFTRGTGPFRPTPCIPVHGDTPVLLPSSPSLPWLGREIENTMARERMHEQRRALLVARVFNPGENTR